MKHFLYKTLAISFWLLAVSVPANADFSLTHQTGAYNELQENGMQSVHTDYQIMYAKPGETVNLYRPERSTFVGYVRWYCYDTDRAIPSKYSAEDSPTGEAIPRIQSTWSNDTLAGSLKFKDRNEYGWFGYTLMQPDASGNGKATATNSNFVEIKYTMHKGDSIYRIACDQGIWNDYSPATWNKNTAMTEPTLSKRTIYEIRPAARMAADLELCKDMDGTNDRYLEEHKLIAPTGRQLYIGPDYMCLGNGVGNNIGDKMSPGKYWYYATTNYYYISSQSEVTPASDKTKWKWYIDGVYDKYGFIAQSAQFAAFSSSTPGTVVYTLKYNSATGVYFNVARFTVTYIDVDEVGPSTKVPAPTNKMEKIYEENFNYDRPGTTDFAFWNGYFDVDESTYGYYTKNIIPTNRQTEQNKITWSEYAVTNRKSVWVSSGTAPQVYQHVGEDTTNLADNAKEGYMLYCDGSQNPGLVFNLKVDADLCPGSTMYFSAWLCDASSSGGDKSAPNMDFVVTGVDASGNEHALTTFTTGAFGINAKAKVGESATMQRAKWYKIMFPVKFDSGNTYHTYRLRITNKGTSSDGNDFAIDDIRIYVQKPPVMPIQASTSNCIDKAVDEIRTYLRIDYQEIDDEIDHLYYQWREGDKVVRSAYFNVDSASTTFGKVNILPDANITSADTCSDLFSFDRQFRETDVPVVRYIKEQVDNINERYVMYIAMPMEVRINRNYTGFVSQSSNTLGDRTGCGTFADLVISGGTRITINDELTLGDSVVTVCGHRDYTLNIVLTAIIQDETQGELRVDTMWCRADWLIGDSAYVDQHPEIYKYSFAQIKYYLIDVYRGPNPTHPVALQMVDFLQKHNLLTLDTASITMSPGVSLSYTAFPLSGSATDATRPVCTTPRFLHIRPADPASNMMVVGTSAEDDEGLPEVVQSRPRVVRISDAQRREGWFDVPLYRIGDESEVYIIDSVYSISSTEPNWHSVTLVSGRDDGMRVQDTIHFGRNDAAAAAEHIRSLKPGYDYTFHVAFVGESDEDQCDRGYTYFTLRIVPDVVTWLGGDWNLDASWDYAIPMDTTSVVLLPDTNYNVSFATEPAESFDFNYTRNHCKNIYIPANTSMAGQENLEIRGVAYVDIPVPAQKWALMSMPIKGIVSGDLFVSHNESTDPFVVANVDHSGTGTTALDRTVYEVYDSPYDAATNSWVRPDSNLSRPILPMDAILIGTDCASGSADPVIRLPKPDNYYRYYDFNTNKWLANDTTVTPTSLRDYLGKPAWNGESTVTLTRANNDNIYVFGNPTFGYIDLTQLMADNEGKLTGEYFMTPAEGTSDPTIDLATIDPSAAHVLLPPCRGVLLEGNGADELTITINVTTPSALSTPAPKRRVQSPLTSFDAQGGMPIGAINPGSIVEVRETDLDIAEVFAAHNNSTIPTLHLYRTLWRDGYYNTLCLPFDQSAEDIDAGPLTGAQVYKFLNAEKVGENQLDIYVEDTTGIKAGVPYLVIWANQGNTIPQPLVFNNVLIKTNKGDTIGASNEVRFAGNIPIGTVELNNENHLFIGANNQLYWPEYDTRMKGFRAHFRVPTIGPAAVPKNTPSRIVVQHQTATGIESVQPSEVSVQKIIIDGNVYIVRDGKMYSILGQTIQ